MKVKCWREKCPDKSSWNLCSLNMQEPQKKSDVYNNYNRYEVESICISHSD